MAKSAPTVIAIKSLTRLLNMTKQNSEGRCHCRMSRPGLFVVIPADQARMAGDDGDQISWRPINGIRPARRRCHGRCVVLRVLGSEDVALTHRFRPGAYTCIQAMS